MNFFVKGNQFNLFCLMYYDSFLFSSKISSNLDVFFIRIVNLKQRNFYIS